MCWFCGEYVVDRIFFTILLSFCLIVICISCYKDYGNRFIECMKSCIYLFIYKEAKIVPLIVAAETNDPIISVAHQIPTEKVKVIWE